MLGGPPPGDPQLLPNIRRLLVSVAPAVPTREVSEECASRLALRCASLAPAPGPLTHPTLLPLPPQACVEPCCTSFALADLG